MVSHPFFLTWMGIVKTYAFAGAFLVIAILLLTEATCGSPGQHPLPWLVGASIAMGLSVSIRIPCVVPAFLGAVWLLATNRSRQGFQHAVVFLSLSLALPALAIALLGASGSQIWFNAVASHAEPIADPWGQRLATLRELLLEPRVSLLTIAGVAAWILRIRGKNRHPDAALAFGIATTLTIGYLLAQPSYTQYWTFALPFWIWSIAPLLLQVLSLKGGRAVLVLLVAISAAGSVAGHEKIRAPYPTLLYLSQPEVIALRAEMARSLPRGSVVASLWPGYIAGTGHRSAPGLENTLGFRSSEMLNREQRREFHALSFQEFRELLLNGVPESVIITTEDIQRHPTLQGDLEKYEITYSTEQVLLLRRRPHP